MDNISATTISTITEKVSAAGGGVAEPLARIYPIVYLDAIHIKLRREGRVANTAVYDVSGRGYGGPPGHSGSLAG